MMTSNNPITPREMEETKEHIMAAGRELLLAAHGALKFCEAYVKFSAPKSSKPHLVAFFQKAVSVADELSVGLLGAAPVKKAAQGIADPILDEMEREMEIESINKKIRSLKKRVAKNSKPIKKKKVLKKKKVAKKSVKKKTIKKKKKVARRA
jgi:hypothetical protein